MIGADYTIRYGANLYQVTRDLNGRLVVRSADGELKVQQCELTEWMPAPRQLQTRTKPAPTPPTGGSQRWMHGFRLEGGPSLEQVVAGAYSNTEADDEGYGDR